MSTTVVQEIGILFHTFKEDNTVILFGSGAPKEFREMSVIHEFYELPEKPLIVGGTIHFGDESFTITALGTQANQNLKELGHISIYFKEPFAEILPGAVFVSPHTFPTINEGTVISFK
jgi:PTS system glucitol/sorbitol-specific IIA component